jgi:hypothetical protein
LQEAYFNPTTGSAVEGGTGNAVFKLSTNAPAGGVSVAFTFTGTATYTSDFAASSVPTGSSITGSGTSGSGVAFFAQGANTVTFPLSTVADGTAEGAENVSGPSGSAGLDMGTAPGVGPAGTRSLQTVLWQGWRSCRGAADAVLATPAAPTPSPPGSPPCPASFLLCQVVFNIETGTGYAPRASARTFTFGISDPPVRPGRARAVRCRPLPAARHRRWRRGRAFSRAPFVAQPPDDAHRSTHLMATPSLPQNQDAFFNTLSATTTEGTTASLVFKLASAAPVGGVSVAFTFTGTAAWSTDFSSSSTPASSSITGSGTSGSGVAFFASGASTVTFTLTTVNDAVYEAGGETVGALGICSSGHFTSQ